MIKNFIERWSRNRDHLRKVLSSCKRKNVDSYLKLMKIVIKNVFNRRINGENDIDMDSLKEINYGGWQGIKLFIFSTDACFTDYRAYEAFVTNVDYGSCTVCDTLQKALGYGDEDERLSQDSVNALMILCSHLIQKTRSILDTDEDVVEKKVFNPFYFGVKPEDMSDEEWHKYTEQWYL